MFGELRNILKHYLIYGGGTILNKALAFLLIPIYTRYLTPAQYGTFSLIELTTFVVEMFLAFGLSQSVLRFYYEYESIEEKKEVVSTSFLASLIICVAGLIPLIFFTGKVSELVFRTPMYETLFRIAILMLFFSIIGEIPLTYLRIKEKSVLYTVISVTGTGLGLVLNIIFVVLLRLEVKGILLSVLITTGLTCLVVSTLMLKEVEWRLSIRKALLMFKYGIPYIPGGLGMFILNFADRFFLQRYSTLSEVGIYTLGYKFGMLLHFIIFGPFMLIWAPKRFDLVKQENGKEMISKVFTYYFFIQLFAGLGLSLLIKDTLRIIAGPEFQEAYKIVPMIVLSYLLLAAYYHIQIGILLEKKTKYIPLIVTISAISNILLCRILVPKYHGMGAAAATLTSFLVMFSLNYFISKKFYSIPFEYSRIVKMVALSCGIFIVGKLFRIDPVFHSIGVNFALSLSFPIFLYFLNFYSKDEIETFKHLWTRINRRLFITPTIK